MPWTLMILAGLAALLAGCAAGSSDSTHASVRAAAGEPGLDLGNFSVSLAVKDLKASRAFYEQLGFSVVGGNADQNWLIMQNRTATIGLFQGMFPRNIMTFNPGWDRNSRTLAKFDDVRDLQQRLRARGLTPAPAADEGSMGPASFMLVDPDGNPILIDQHVPRPKD